MQIAPSGFSGRLIDEELQVTCVLSWCLCREEHFDVGFLVGVQCAFVFVHSEGREVGLFDPPINRLVLRISDLEGLTFAIDQFRLFDNCLSESDLLIRSDQLVLYSCAFAGPLELLQGLGVQHEERKVKFIFLCGLGCELENETAATFGVDA